MLAIFLIVLVLGVMETIISALLIERLHTIQGYVVRPTNYFLWSKRLDVVTWIGLLVASRPWRLADGYDGVPYEVVFVFAVIALLVKAVSELLFIRGIRVLIIGAKIQRFV